jgi:hypothetical protein
MRPGIAVQDVMSPRVFQRSRAHPPMFSASGPSRSVDVCRQAYASIRQTGAECANAHPAARLPAPP